LSRAKFTQAFSVMSLVLDPVNHLVRKISLAACLIFLSVAELIFFAILRFVLNKITGNIKLLKWFSI
jgi:hypothetical protein